MSTAPPLPLTKADFQSNQETRWCPGCGDYSVLAAIQGFMPELGIPPEKIVFVTGIGCAGRFAYYMDTYGMHAIHGRAPTIATGLAAARDDLSVWIVSGDGDALSIGANHLVHALRRNVPVKILLFNNRIYGLTKGQASPTSEFGKVTKSTPGGSIDPPLDALSLALGAGATFVARTVDRDKQGLVEVLRAAAEHRGTAFVEVLQDCPVFNDGAFDHLTQKDAAAVNRINLVDGQPIRFGLDHELGVVRDDDGTLGVARVDEVGADRLIVHDATCEDPSLAFALARLGVLGAGPAAARASSAPSTRRRGAATSSRSCATRVRGWATTTSTPCCTRATPGPSPARAGSRPPPRLRQAAPRSRPHHPRSLRGGPRPGHRGEGVCCGADARRRPWGRRPRRPEQARAPRPARTPRSTHLSLDAWPRSTNQRRADDNPRWRKAAAPRAG